MFTLRQLSLYEDINIYNMLQKIGSDENKFHNEVYGLTYFEFKEWLSKQIKWAKGEELPEGYVRQWIYWFYDESMPVGFGKLREKLTENSYKLGGNIGYAIASNHRGKGYGVILFKMLLHKAKELGITEVISTVEKGNTASKIIQEKCGGILIDENEYRWHFSFNEILKLF